MSTTDAAEAQGRIALVTGASRGIGAATVRALHRDGASVIIHAGRNRAAAEALAAELGSDTLVVVGDLTDPTARASIWEQALGWRGRLDVLVNNAGAWIASPLDDTDQWQQGWEDNLSLNLTACADLCRFAILHWSTTPSGGVIVNVASRSSHRGDDAEHLAYGAAKGGLLALTKGIARAFARHRVLAYAVAPGLVQTGLSGGTDLEAVVKTLPMQEITPPEDVAEVIAFLASGRSPHTTGATIDITGEDYVR